MVRGEEVLITSREICEFYDILYYGKHFLNEIDLNTFKDIEMKDVVRYLTQGRGTWNYRLDTTLPTNFNQVIMFLVAKM